MGFFRGFKDFLSEVGSGVTLGAVESDPQRRKRKGQEAANIAAAEAAAKAAQTEQEQAAMLGSAGALRRMRLARGMQATMLASLGSLPVRGSGGRKALLGQ